MLISSITYWHKRIQQFILIATFIAATPIMANPCASLNPISKSGVGGTGIDTEQGVGGTGIDTEQGVGGTGIVGVITGFGSICVGDLEVHLDSSTPVNVDGITTNEHQFSIGQMVAIDAVEKNKKISATNIHVFHPIIGPITAIDANKNLIKVMNQKISVKPSVIKTLTKGQWIGVSGLRNGQDQLKATLIDTNIKVKKASIIGTLKNSNGKHVVGATNIIGIDQLSKSQINHEVKLSGKWDGKNLKVENLTAGPANEMMQRVEHLYVQTVLLDQSENKIVNIGGKQIPIKQVSHHKANTPILIKLNISKGRTRIENIKTIKHSILNQDENNHREWDTPKHSNHKREQEDQSMRSETNTDTKIESPEIRNHEKIEIQHLEKVEIEKPEKIEIEKPEKIEIEKPEKIEIEKPEKIEIEKPEKIEIEKPEKIEIEKPEFD